MTVLNNQGKQVPICSCGRDKVRVHCTLCGLRNCYIIRGLCFTVPRGDGTELRVSSYRCRGCGNEFNDLDRENCQALKKPLSVAAQRIADQFNDIPWQEKKRIAFAKIQQMQDERNRGFVAKKEPIVEEETKPVKQTIKPFELGDDTQVLRAEFEHLITTEPTDDEKKLKETEKK